MTDGLLESFKARYSFPLDPFQLRAIEAIQDGLWVYRVIYQAAARYYFDHDLQNFERVLGSFRLLTKSA